MLKKNIRNKWHIDWEFKVGPFFLDGKDLENKTIFDFNCCWHHAYPECSSDTIFNKSSVLIFKFINIRHKDMIYYIKDRMPDFKLVEIWEHELKGKLDEIVDEIIPRKALSGEHSIAFNLYNIFKDVEKINMLIIRVFIPVCKNMESSKRASGNDN